MNVSASKKSQTKNRIKYVELPSSKTSESVENQVNKELVVYESTNDTLSLLNRSVSINF